MVISEHIVEGGRAINRLFLQCCAGLRNQRRRRGYSTVS